ACGIIWQPHQEAKKTPIGKAPSREAQSVSPQRLATLGILPTLAICIVLSIVFVRYQPCGECDPLNPRCAPIMPQSGTVVDGLSLEPDSLLPVQTNKTQYRIVDQALWAPLW